MRAYLFVSVATSALFMSAAVMAGDPVVSGGQTINIEQASQLLQFAAGNDHARLELSPNYSDELGWSFRGVAGSHLTDEIALGLLVEYGQNKREYLANTGIQLGDAMSIVGTVGMLEEHNEYVEGDGREVVRQMEYGVSLKGSGGEGVFSGIELNGYLADASTDSENAEVGKLYGAQLLTDLALTDTTLVKLGGGYEWLEWEGGEKDNAPTFSAIVRQGLGDVLSVHGEAKLGASEYVYGGGLSLDFSNGGQNTNAVSLNYTNIDGKNSIENDWRIMLGWTLGFRGGPAADGSSAASAHAASGSSLLSAVTERPAYLPERVLARGGGGGTLSCESFSFYETQGGPGLGQYYSTFVEVYAIYPTVDPALLEGRNISAYFEGVERTYVVGMNPLALEFNKIAVNNTSFADGNVADIVLEIDGVPCPALQFAKFGSPPP